MFKDQIFYFLLFSFLYIAIFHIYKKSKLSAFVFILMGLSGLTGSYYSAYFRPYLNPINAMTVGDIATHSVFFLFCSFSFVFLLSKKNLNLLIEYLSLICLFNSMYLIAKWSLGLPVIGLMLNTSCEGTFLAIVIPIMFFKKDQMKFFHNCYLFVIPIIACFLTTSSMGIGGMALGFFVYFARDLKKGILIGSVIFFLIFLAAYFFLGKSFFNDSLRFICWKWSFDWWIPHANKWIGTGLGTFWGIGPWIQDKNVSEICTLSAGATCEAAKVKYQFGNYYTFMHSDFLQVLFELGIIGFLTLILTLAICLFRSFKRRWLLTSVVVYFSQSLGNMPSRYVLTALVGICLLRICLEKEDDYDL